MLRSITRFLRDEEGATAIEYGIIAGLISVAIISFLPGIGTKLGVIFQKIDTAITSAGTPAGPTQ
ncbi:Flp family type IVb pilin [Variovorax beijingensis]|uniref:Flp family type IVb pilin n=1 Tax=Variovorax beijingensis TaxID=2496117 RepID=UPI0011A6E664|nr:Flp family type IVb pilin [Variovorax beijingensis]